MRSYLPSTFGRVNTLRYGTGRFLHHAVGHWTIKGAHILLVVPLSGLSSHRQSKIFDRQPKRAFWIRSRRRLVVLFFLRLDMTRVLQRCRLSTAHHHKSTGFGEREDPRHSALGSPPPLRLALYNLGRLAWDLWAANCQLLLKKHIPTRRLLQHL